jgi:hypothetical protein
MQEQLLIGILEHPMKDFIQTIECTVIEYKGRTYNTCMESKYIPEGIELYNPLTGIHKMQ